MKITVGNYSFTFAKTNLNILYNHSIKCCFSEIRFNFALEIKAFFVYCKVVKEKEYSSFLNR